MAATLTRPAAPDALKTQLKNLKITMPHGQFAWPSYVTPRTLARDVVLEQVKPAMVGEMSMASEFDDIETGWRMHLCHRSSLIVKATPEAMARRLYTVLNGPGLISYIDAIEGWLMAAGLELDLDTRLPVMPGNRYLALDMLQVRAEQLDPNVQAEDVLHLVPDLMELCLGIVTNPEQAEDLMNDAPFNCLRPMDR